MMATLTILLSAASLYALAVTALLSVALYGNADVAAELRREREHNERLLDDLDHATARLAVLEARGLPELAEIRAVECCASGRCEVCSPGYVWGMS